MESPSLRIVSRFSRTHARRAGGIHTTAMLSASHLRSRGWQVTCVSDQIAVADFDVPHDITWIYSTEEQVLEVLDRMPASTHRVIAVSSWTPSPRGEATAVRIADRFRAKFPRLWISAWTEAGARAVSRLTAMQTVRLTHLQNTRSDQPNIGGERKGVCIGEVAKIQRAAISSFSPRSLVEALRAQGFDEPIYAYAQYSEDLGSLAPEVTLAPKLPQSEFFNWLSTLRCVVHTVDGETFGAPPIEAASCGTMPVIPPMPQSLDEYIDERIPRFVDEYEAANIVTRLSRDVDFSYDMAGVLEAVRKSVAVSQLADQLSDDLMNVLRAD